MKKSDLLFYSAWFLIGALLFFTLLSDLSEYSYASSCIIITLLALYCFYKAGRERGVFEVVLIFDTAKWWLGERFSRAAFEASKDKNYDGKVSYWERTFPNDGGHRAKLSEQIHLSLALLFSMFGFVFIISAVPNEYQWYVFYGYAILMTIARFVVFSAGFLHSFKLYRNPPPEIHSDYQGPTQFTH